MPTALAELGMQAAGNAAGGILGLALGGVNDKRQLKQQKKLQALQIAGNKEMTDYQMQKELAMWKATNYSAQRDELEKAGLNAALLYGMSGGGGTTTGGSGGGVSGAAAPQGGGEIQAGMGMGLQIGMMQAQKGLIEAQTRNVEADTAKKSGVDTKKVETEISSLTQGIKNAQAAEKLTEAETKIKKLQGEIQERTMEDTMKRIQEEALKVSNELEILERYNILDKGTQREKYKIIVEQATEAALKNALLRQGKDIGDAQLKQMAQNLILSFQEYSLKAQSNDRDAQRLGKEQSELLLKQMTQLGLDQNAGNMVLELIQTLGALKTMTK